LVQRHVRPIVRGMARAAVEFGAKISVSVRNGFAYPASQEIQARARLLPRANLR
jgi:hypothetical protein